MKLLFLLLLSQIVLSQNTLEVVYNTSFLGDFVNKKNKNSEVLKNFNDGVEKKISALQFQLLIHDKKSIFKSISQMEKEDETTGEKMAKIIVGFENEYYTDLKIKKIIIDELFTEKKIKVDLGFDTFKWEYLNEFKEISGYRCYLAKTKFAHLEVYAWYCPILPYSFGPLEFCNLPGLILELQKGNIVFQAEKITLNSKNKIDFNLLKFQTITLEQRDNILKKQKESFTTKYKN